MTSGVPIPFVNVWEGICVHASESDTRGRWDSAHGGAEYDPSFAGYFYSGQYAVLYGDGRLSHRLHDQQIRVEIRGCPVGPMCAA